MVIANKADAMVVIDELTRERAALRAENARLQHESEIEHEANSALITVIVEIGETLGAEVNKGECTETIKAAKQVVAENARLREALRAVLDNALDDYYAENDPDHIISRARARLEGDQ